MHSFHPKKAWLTNLIVIQILTTPGSSALCARGGGGFGHGDGIHGGFYHGSPGYRGFWHPGLAIGIRVGQEWAGVELASTLFNLLLCTQIL